MIALALLIGGSVASAAPGYRVDHSLLRGRSVIVDHFGREVVFRGVNVGVEIWRGDRRPWDPDAYADGKCPSAEGSVNQPPVCGVEAGHGKWNQSTHFDSKNDLAQMRALGFNLIRLAMSWSLLEPKPLQYANRYLDRIAQVVSWAAEQDIDVILDMHQDEYGATIGEDGAPAWAVMNVSYPAWVDALWPKISAKIPFSKEVLSAFDALYLNRPVATTGKGLQEHFLLAWAEVIKRFDGVPNVVGYEIINEPPPGIATIVNSLKDVPVLGFATDFLFPMYRRFIQAMMGVRDGLPTCSGAQPVISNDCAYPDLGIKSTKIVFFEPVALRNQLDFSLQISKPFTEYGNIVFSPHVYTYSFTSSSWPPTYRLALDSAWTEANLMGAGVLATEFGGSASTPDRIGNISQQFDVHRGTSGTMWDWKEHGSWGIFKPSTDPAVSNGPVNPTMLRTHSKIYSRAVAGGILEHSFDQGTGAFRLKSLAGPGWGMPTEVYIPAHLPDGQPSVSGAAKLKDVITQPDGSRVVQVEPWFTGGLYQVAVGSPSLSNDAPAPVYKGVSEGTLNEIARAIWPMDRSSADLSEDSLAIALAQAGSEIYATQSPQYHSQSLFWV